MNTCFCFYLDFCYYKIASTLGLLKQETFLFLKKKMEVANSVTCIILLILFCGSAAGIRKELFSFNSQENGIVNMAALAPSSEDGICKSMVETRGYVCEEHTVNA